MVGGCQKKEPGAGMDSTLGLTKVYKDGYFHLRCMMDKMETAADWHDELQRDKFLIRFAQCKNQVNGF